MLISLLVAVIVIGLLIYLVQMLPLPAPWGQVAIVLIVLIAILWLVGALGGPGFGGIGWHRCG